MPVRPVPQFRSFHKLPPFFVFYCPLHSICCDISGLGIDFPVFSCVHIGQTVWLRMLQVDSKDGFARSSKDGGITYLSKNSTGQLVLVLVELHVVFFVWAKWNVHAVCVFFLPSLTR